MMWGPLLDEPLSVVGIIVADRLTPADLVLVRRMVRQNGPLVLLTHTASPWREP